MRHAVVDHQDPVERVRVAGGNHLAWLLHDLDEPRPLDQPPDPPLHEDVAMVFHQLAGALRGARPVSDVDDPRARLVHGLQAAVVESEAEIAVLVVRG